MCLSRPLLVSYFWKEGRDLIGLRTCVALACILGAFVEFSPLSLTPLLSEASGAVLKAVGPGTFALALLFLSSSAVSVPASLPTQI